MEAVVLQRSLLNLLQKVQSIIEKKSTMPVLSHTLLKTKDNRIIAMATDLEVAFKGEIIANIIVQGEVLVPAKPLYDILRNLSSEEVRLKASENGRLEIRSRRSHFSLVTMPTEEFPIFPETEGFTLLSASSDILRKGILKTYFSMAREDENSSYAGLYMEKNVEEKKLCLVSTDTFRLTYKEIPFPEVQSLQFDKGIMIPRKAVMEILRLTGLEAESGHKSILIGADHQAFVLKTTPDENMSEEAEGGSDEDKTALLSYLFYTRLMENKFPDYSALIPSQFNYEAIIPRDEFKSCLKRMNAIMTEEMKIGTFYFGKNGLLVQIEDRNTGEAEEEIEIKFSKGKLEVDERTEERIIVNDKVRMVFNIPLLLDIINALDSEEFFFGLNVKDYPCLISEDKDMGFKALIAPIVERMSEEM